MRGLDSRWLTFGIVVLVGVLRLLGISDNSITQDESTMLLFAKGVLERGYPFIYQAHAEFLISTYELVPYPIAASIGLLGFSEFSARLPAVLFAIGTSLLILRFGTILFDRRVGVLAALLFAVLPWSIYWGSNAFYPSQVQFFALLTTVVIHRMITEERPAPWVNYALLATFTLSYLSWEGSGFLLPVFFAMILFLRWGKWQWLASVHAWTAAALIVLLVIGQLTYRTLLREPFLGIVSGRSEVSFAKLAFTNVNFDPFFYITGLASEAHIALAFFLAVGVFMLHRSWSLRFLYLFLCLIVIFLTAFLGYYALRYIYLALPLMLIAAAAVTVQLADQLTKARATQAADRGRQAVMFSLVALHFSVVSSWGLQPLEMSATFTSARPNELRRSLPGFSFRTIAQELMARYQKGDVIIVQAPFPFQVYTGMRGDYLLQSVSASSVFYVPGDTPYYTDKWLANPVLRNERELDDVLMRHGRVWFVSTPDGASRRSVGKDLYDRVTNKMDMVAETGDGRLYLWRHPGRE